MELENYKNIHEGERVFILGNGPSLANTPLEKLENEITFACNRINLVYSQTSWRPSYYVYIKGAPPTKKKYQYVMETVEQNIPTFMSSDNIPHFPNKKNILEINEKPINNVPTDASEPLNEYFDSTKEMATQSWSKDISEKLYNYGGTLYRSTQIATYMGFDEIIFVGCDGYKYEQKGPLIFPNANNPKEYTSDDPLRYFKFLTDKGMPIRSAINGLSFKLHNSRVKNITNSLFNDNNHFHPKYNIEYTSPDEIKERNESHINMHNAIKAIGQEYNFDTYNATLEKNIHIHTPVDLYEII